MMMKLTCDMSLSTSSDTSTQNPLKSFRFIPRFQSRMYNKNEPYPSKTRRLFTWAVATSLDKIHSPKQYSLHQQLAIIKFADKFLDIIDARLHLLEPAPAPLPKFREFGHALKKGRRVTRSRSEAVRLKPRKETLKSVVSDTSQVEMVLLRPTPVKWTTWQKLVECFTRK